MKHIIVHDNGIVIDFRCTGLDITSDNIALTDDIPKFVPKDGYNGVLKYSDTDGLYWDYEEVSVVEETDNSEEQAYIDGIVEEVSAE